MRVFTNIAVLGLLTMCARAGAIDCSRARTPPEIAICTDTTLRVFDQYLEEAYQTVKENVPAADFDVVRRSQRQWIRDRDSKCDADITCMITETQRRTAALNGFAQRYIERGLFGGTGQWGSEDIGKGVRSGDALTPQQIYRLATQSVVVVLGANRRTGDISQGSGVAIEAETVATNCHVVADTDALTVLYRDEIYPAAVMRRNEAADLCVVAARGLPAVPAGLGRLDDVVPGQRVYSIGSPRGLELTIAEGLVSGLRRKGALAIPLIQTSAPISPGSSGGGLFDEYGRVIGITTFRLRDSQNLNFAVPVELLRL